ncbi:MULTISPECIES: Rrf2 family transcriptional regulator [unclassified Thioalkalivibrio]|uniref:Rrf2 family transcriptional regulator n=1 Tax=unclassified Thioalkalivibrio TaxID=2621013 RepID=UPI00037C9C6E|nr:MULTISPECIES: Rrf2 family transcriptional regulator [unclassified Thioalkalivibrio]
MLINERSLYTLRVALQIAHHSQSRSVPTSELLAAHGFKDSYLCLLTRDLSDAGLVTAKKRGTSKYRLTRPASEVSVGDVVASVEGGRGLSFGGDPEADPASGHPISKGMKDMSAKLRAWMDSVSLESLLSESHGEFSGQLHVVPVDHALNTAARERDAIMASAYIAEHDDQRVRAHTIADLLELKEPYVLAVLRTLVRHSVLDRTPGKFGGYKLKRPACELKVYDVMKVMADTRRFRGATIDLSITPENAPVFRASNGFIHQFEEFFRSMTFADILGHSVDRRKTLVQDLKTSINKHHFIFELQP